MYQSSPIYLVDGLRSGFGRLYGSLSDLRIDDLGAQLLQGLWQRHRHLPPSALDAFLIGCANQSGEDARNLARQVLLLAGGSPQTSCLSLNSLCTAGLEAVLQAARGIALGEWDLCIAGGLENMSRSPWIVHRQTGEKADSTIGWRFVNPKLSLLYSPYSMAETVERLSQKLGIERQEQDQYAFMSRERYLAAQAQGLFEAEIFPVLLANQQYFSRDEQVRQIGLDSLSKLPASSQFGSRVSIGNSAKGGDGGGLLLLASERAVQRWGLKPKARLRAWANVGLHPDDMGMGAAQAIQKLLQQQGLSLGQFSSIELAESFAGQVLACCQALGLKPSQINRFGGGIAAGNPTAVGSLRPLIQLLHRSARAGDWALLGAGAGLGLGLALWLEHT
jgi:acetyl-CoA acetyltransferase family protein